MSFLNSSLRILLTHHDGAWLGASGQFARRLAVSLAAAGAQVRGLAVGRVVDGDGLWQSVALDDFPPPRFLEEPGTGPSFESLDDRQLDRYLDGLRRRLDREIDQFNPHVVHAQHVWIWAHLALEAGVPYVASVWPEELASMARDRRFRRLTQEGADNAGRLLVADRATSSDLAAACEELDSARVIALPRRGDEPDVDALLTLYRELVAERFGDGAFF